VPHMNFQWSGSSARRITTLLGAILFGIAVGVGLVPEAVSARVQAILHSGYAYLAAGLLLLVFAVLGLFILEMTVDKQHQLDRILLDAFMEHIPDNVFFKDLDSRFVRISSAMATYCGLADSGQAMHKTDADVFTAEHAQQALADEKEIIRTGCPIIEKEEKETWPDGHETWVLTTKVPLRDRSSQIIGTMGIAHNITDRKQAELRIRHMALHDSLTGLPNRALLEDRLSQAIAWAERNRNRVGLLFLDLDRFKNVNDTFGHYVGDRLLESVSVRLKQCLRDSDTIARLGGDEFVIALLMSADQGGIERVAQKVLESLTFPFRVEGHELQMGASIGICQFPEDGQSAADLLRFADAAMYEAKNRGRGRYCFFSPALTDATQRRQKMENDLLQACARDEFVLHYQPLIETESGRISAVEALIRWRHPELGLISPNQFIPQLEELGLMVEVGRWVLKTACRQAMEWQQLGLPPIRMAVNVSAQQFYQGSIVDTVGSILRETELSPKLLELELTESRTLDGSDATITIMQGLKRLGVSLSLDDFGTGWSSLSYLRRFPIDRIKIDRSFVRDVLSQHGAEAVVKSILGLGKNLGIECVAEGVETRQERDYLKKHRCAEMQGFFFSKPITAVDITALLMSAKSGRRDMFDTSEKRDAPALI
jgi:diguanylate cyclase (GGDEF)-like protein/PAS domain S-box-containing protein